MNQHIMSEDHGVCVLSGGVGGAKLILGLSKVLKPEEFMVVCNTGDDFVHLGLHISPDIDTVLYTLADLVDEQRGWGLKNETWNFLESIKNLGGEGWFNLGDRDLATHVERTRRIKAGESISQITQNLSQALKLKNKIIPMTDSPVQTIVETVDGPLTFQHYFVRDKCLPEVTGFRFEGIETSRPSGCIHEFFSKNQTSLLIAPSNPFVSIDPIIGIPGFLDILKNLPGPKLAVSPIVNGIAIKGPAAKMMKELGIPSTSVEVARHYRDLIDAIVIDQSDCKHMPEIENLGVKVFITKTVMNTLEDKIVLAKECLNFISCLQGE